jgi:hypothetical protein
MRKSLKSLFNGTVDRVYAENDTVADEMFNNLAKQTGKTGKFLFWQRIQIIVLFAAGVIGNLCHRPVRGILYSYSNNRIAVY